MNNTVRLYAIAVLASVAGATFAVSVSEPPANPSRTMPIDPPPSLEPVEIPTPKPPGTETPSPPSTATSAELSRLDLDHDGFISRQEWVEGIATRQFGDWDDNGDGRISKEEWQRHDSMAPPPQR